MSEQQQENVGNQGGNEYHVKFPFDFGRGFPELCFYWPARKELRVEVKNADGEGEAIKMNPDIMSKNPSDDMIYIWDATRFHRKWHDDDLAGVELDPKLAPPGIYDNDIPVPPGVQPSIKDQPTRSVDIPKVEDTHPTEEGGAAQAESGQQVILGHGQGHPTADPQMRIGNQPAILLDLTTYNDYQTLIEVDGMVNETLMTIIERTVDPESIEMSIVKIQREKSQEIRGRLYGDSSGEN